jgi:hypothetical protein
VPGSYDNRGMTMKSRNWETLSVQDGAKTLNHPKGLVQHRVSGETPNPEGAKASSWAVGKRTDDQHPKRATLSRHGEAMDGALRMCVRTAREHWAIVVTLGDPPPSMTTTRRGKA